MSSTTIARISKCLNVPKSGFIPLINGQKIDE
jgi:hypothetical protein